MPAEPEIESPTILLQAIKLLEEDGISLSSIAEAINISNPDLIRLIGTSFEKYKI